MTRLTRTSGSRRLIARHADRESLAPSPACDIWQRQGRAHGGRHDRRISDPFTAAGGVPVAADFTTTATIHTDSSATGEELDDVLGGLIEHRPWAFVARA